MNKYWESEPDIKIDTGKNFIKFWRNAGKLQFQMPKYIDKKDGMEKPGKLVTVDIDALRETDGAVQQLKNILVEIA